MKISELKTISKDIQELKIKLELAKLQYQKEQVEAITEQLASKTAIINEYKNVLEMSTLTFLNLLSEELNAVKGGDADFRTFFNILNTDYSIKERFLEDVQVANCELSIGVYDNNDKNDKVYIFDNFKCSVSATDSQIQTYQKVEEFAHRYVLDYDKLMGFATGTYDHPAKIDFDIVWNCIEKNANIIRKRKKEDAQLQKCDLEDLVTETQSRIEALTEIIDDDSQELERLL